MLMILTYTTNIGKIFELTLGQGQKVKGQGQISNNVKRLVKLTKKSRDRQMQMILTHIAYIGQMFKLT